MFLLSLNSLVMILPMGRPSLSIPSHTYHDLTNHFAIAGPTTAPQPIQQTESTDLPTAKSPSAHLFSLGLSLRKPSYNQIQLSAFLILTYLR
jgi:hypothetical protein